MSNYSLQKYKGTSTRHTCPNCGDRRSFAYYVDESGTPLHPSVGRCNHESGCGYHYTPKQYFHDHPECRTAGDFSSGRQCMAQKPKQPLQQTAIGYIPPHYVEKSQSVNSNFCRFLSALLLKIKQRVLTAQQRAIYAANEEMLRMYWDIGGMLQQSQDADGWGKKTLQRLAVDLKNDYSEIKGFTVRNMQYMVQSITNHWTTRYLQEAIKLDDYGKHGALANNFTETLPVPEANDVKSMLNDQYIFDMLTFTEQYNERDVEIGLVKHVEKFLVEMGAGFAFMG